VSAKLAYGMDRGIFKSVRRPWERSNLMQDPTPNTKSGYAATDSHKPKLLNPMTKVDSNTKALVGLRIAVGMLFLIFGEYKVFGTQFTLGGGFQYWINRFLEEGAYPFMVPLLRDFVLHYANPIAFLVAYGELSIGLSLVLGILVRPASICGLIYMLTLLFSSNYAGPHAAFWQYFGAALEHLVLALCFAAFTAGKPEEALSVGSYLRRHRPV